jgi:phosphatidylglycerophosphate synthase
MTVLERPIPLAADPRGSVGWLASAFLVLVGAAGALGLVLGWAVAAVGVFSYLLLAGLVSRHHRGRRFGAANLITLVRGLGMSLIAGLAAQAWLDRLDTRGVAVIIGIGTVCISLDGVDGKLARARGEATVFGARFDMEIDAATILVLSIAVSALGFIGWWVLAIGAIRYVYVAASWVVPAFKIPVQVRLSGRIIAVAQGVALLACLLIGVLGTAPAWLPSLLAAAAFTALTWSFARDIAWQVRTARLSRAVLTSPASTSVLIGS